MDLYGVKGVIYAQNKNDLKIRISEGYDGYSEKEIKIDNLKAPFDDPFAYFAAVIRGEVIPKPYDLSTLENNMIVMEILDAAIRSADSMKTVKLSD